MITCIYMYANIQKYNYEDEYLIGLICWFTGCIPHFHVLPFSDRWQSSQWWQTTCGPWYHWLHSWGCQSAWSDPLEANFSTNPSGLSWSEMGSEPVNSKSSVSICCQVHQQTNWQHSDTECETILMGWSTLVLNSLSPIQSSHRFELAGLQRKVDNQQPSRISALPEPTSPQLYCNPGKREGKKGLYSLFFSLKWWLNLEC